MPPQETLATWLEGHWQAWNVKKRLLSNNCLEHFSICALTLWRERQQAASWKWYFASLFLNRQINMPEKASQNQFYGLCFIGIAGIAVLPIPVTKLQSTSTIHRRSQNARWPECRMSKPPMPESEMAISHVFSYSHNKRYRKEPVHSMTLVLSATSSKTESLFGVSGVTRVAAQQGNVDLARESKSLAKPNNQLHSVMIEPRYS